MELADDIAYGIHDLEDSIVMGMVNYADFISDVAEPLIELDIPGISDKALPLAERNCSVNIITNAKTPLAHW